MERHTDFLGADFSPFPSCNQNLHLHAPLPSGAGSDS